MRIVHASCETCRFYISMECRRRAPDRGRPDGATTATWPTTRFNDWCGEHEPKPEAQKVQP